MNAEEVRTGDEENARGARGEAEVNEVLEGTRRKRLDEPQERDGKSPGVYGQGVW